MTKRNVDIIEYVKLGAYNAVKACIAKGDNIDECDYSGNCAVMASAKSNNMEIFKLLVNSCANLNVRDESGHTLW